MQYVKVEPAIFWTCECGQGNFDRPVESGEAVETVEVSFGFAVPSHDVDDNSFIADECGEYVMVIPSKVQCGKCREWRLVAMSEGDAEGEDDAE
jgi:hypothetical protein